MKTLREMIGFALGKVTPWLQYSASPETLSDGEYSNQQCDATGNAKVTIAGKLAGEDLINDVTKTEQRFIRTNVLADNLVKSGAGFLHSISFSQSDAAPTAGTITIYDNTAESGTILYQECFTTTVFRGFSIIIDAAFSTGLYVGFSTTADVNVGVSYR